jgi:hypothetical protein
MISAIDRAGERGTDVELRKSRRLLLAGAFSIVLGAFILLCGRADGAVRMTLKLLVGGSMVVTGGAFVVSELKPFRFHIGTDGLTLRLNGINRLVRWDEIDAVILDLTKPSLVGDNKHPYHHVLLVPADGVDLGIPLTHRSPVDDRPCLVLLDLRDVRDSPEQVAQALAQFGGGRFTDARRRRADRFGSPDFTVVLRGYDPARVDELIRRGRDALTSSSTLERHGVKAEIEGARGKLPIVARGYDRDQVDSFLSALSTELAIWDSGEQQEHR